MIARGGFKSRRSAQFFMLTNTILTAYCACRLCCGPHAAGLCADGRKPVAGVTVAAPRAIPLGTRLQIQGFTNRFVVQDRTARRYDGRIDIYFATHAEARRFGIRTNTVQFFK